MNVLVVDVGGSHVKILVTGQNKRRKFSSGPKMTPEEMVSGVKELAEDWNYDVVSIGYPGAVLRDRVMSEPHNLAKGWVGFDFPSAFGCQVKIINDAAMQALGSDQEGISRSRGTHDDTDVNAIVGSGGRYGYSSGSTDVLSRSTEVDLCTA